MLRAACILALLLVLWTATAAAEPDFPTYDDNGEALTIVQFVERYIPEDMPEGLGRAEIQAALEDAGTNWVELAQTLTSVGRVIATHFAESELEPLRRRDLELVCWLIVRAPHLDRLELTDAILAEHLSISTLVAAEMPLLTPEGQEMRYNSASDLFRRYVLNYRLDDEPVSQWRAELLTEFGELARDGSLRPEEQLQSVFEIAQRLAHGFTILERGYFGNQSDPLSLLQSRTGTARELAILVGAALRSQGYATRLVREGRSGESWLEVYSGDPREYDPHAWTPVYPTAPERSGDVSYATELCGGRITVVTAGDAFGREQVTGRYLPQGYVRPVFTRTSASGAEVEDAEFSGWAITAWNAKTGGYVALDDLDYPSVEKDYPLSAYGHTPEEGVYALGPGEYRLECGVRYPGGTTHVQTVPFSLSHAEQLTLRVSLDPPEDLPAAAMVEREVAAGPASLPAAQSAATEGRPTLQSVGRYVFLYRDDSEPSIRAAELLEPLRARSSVFYQELRLDNADEAQMAFVDDVLRISDDDPLPVVIVVVDGQTRLYLRGYNLNIAQWVERALEGE